jgi:hypothetical protein
MSGLTTFGQITIVKLDKDVEDTLRATVQSILESAKLEEQNMNVLSDLTLKHLVQYVLVYPIGCTPPGIEASEFSRFEDYRFAFTDTDPQIGENCPFNDANWVVIDIQTYSPQASDSPTQSLHIVVCTQDGQPVDREDWDSAPPILYIPVLANGTLALNEDGSSHYGIIDDARYLPRRNIFEDWEISQLQWFEPTQETANQGFKAIALCWCEAPVEATV